MNVGEKIMAKYMNKSKNYETYFEFFFWSIIEIYFSKDRNICTKFALESEMSLFQIFLMLQWSWRNYGQISKYIKIYYHFAI